MSLKKKSNIIFLLAILVTIAYYIAADKIYEYVSLDTLSARTSLYKTSLKLFVDYFPLGTGFGTFASSLSSSEGNYSLVYYLYNLQNIEGLIEGNAIFAADVFWPCILGQNGICGFFIYLIMLFKVFKYNLYSNISNNCKAACLILWIYAFIASSTEAYFSNSTGVQFAIFLFLIIGIRQKNVV